MTCSRAQEFLERNGLGAATVVDAKKTPLGRADALALASQVDEIYASKGKKVVHLHVKGGKSGQEEITDLIVGPSGNLRAPTLKYGRTLLVGFDEETYHRVLKKPSVRCPGAV